MNEQQNSFFDSKTLLTILIVGIIWVAWEKHLQKKYPDAYRRKFEVAQPHEKPNTSTTLRPSENQVSSEKFSGFEKNIPPEKLVHVEDSNWKFDISSYGMGIKNLTLKTMTDRSGKEIRIGESKDYFPMETQIINDHRSIIFNITKISEQEYQGIGTYNGAVIKKIMTIDSANNTFAVKVSATDLPSDFKGFITFVSDKITPPEPKGFFQKMFFPSYDLPDYFVLADGKTARHTFMDDSQFEDTRYERVSHYSIGSHYFALAFVDKSQVLPEISLSLKTERKEFIGTLQHKVINPSNHFEINYLVYAGPKSLDQLAKIDPVLPEVINFGVFGFLSRPMLRIMKAFYNVFNNWGVAIILLTLLVRIFVFPFNKMSYRSIKAMQTIQPMLKALQEKYKDNRQELNLATMKLMKEHKVNPLGGCLPMLLQLPIFFALYQVFGQSIELYKAPFVFWIKDLSAKDPYYVLPIGMAITMLIQQKLTPSSMDPTQAKVMMFVPLLFSLMMINLPSALNLYIFVSSLFAVIQQAYFLQDGKDKSIILTKAKLVEK